ncbi:MAG TPA: T9SS type A sorting domain-containing protein, partial [Prolixibacteraceae bacterium]|nr:T9SS type A sorting domain-containing protein [Prolixibacteraceae bacterium]
DLKVNDVDADDAMNTDDPPVAKPAEYWWNTTSNDAYAVTYYAGFLSAGGTVGIWERALANSIFERVTPNFIQFNKMANVAVYNILGAQVMAKKDVSRLDLSNLNRGIYIIRANGESRKIVR